MKKSNKAAKNAKNENTANDATVAQCIAELLRNPRTPGGLYEAIAVWICDMTTASTLNVLHTPPVIAMVIADSPDSERRGALIALRAKGGDA